MSALDQLVDDLAEKVVARVLPRLLSALSVKDEGAVETIQQFAQRYKWSRRHVTKLIAEGLPTVGAGRGVRIRSHVADTWLAARGATESASDDNIDAMAREAARRPPRRRRAG